MEERRKENRKGTNHIPEREDRKVEDLIVVGEYCLIVIGVGIILGCIANLIQGVMK